MTSKTSTLVHSKEDFQAAPPAPGHYPGRTDPGFGVAQPGLRNPICRDQRLRAVLFDLDGTLYSQRLLRALMLIELLALPLRRPFTWWRTWRTISAYRSAQESLRTSDGTAMDAEAQVNAAAIRAAVPAADVQAIVQEWMLERPL